MQDGRNKTEISNITAAILAGGFGTRLKPVLSDSPKPLAPVNDRPFVYYLLDQIADAGLHHVVLCTGYLGDKVRAQLGGFYRCLQLEYSQEPEPLGTAGALRLAVECFRSGTVLALNGDSYCDVDLRAFYVWHQQRQASASIVLTTVENSERFGSVLTNPDGTISRFGEKVAATEGCWINAGIYLIARQLIEEIPIQQSVSLERDVFPGWIGRGFFGYHHRGKFLDIGTPQSYAEAPHMLAAKGLS